ncbi:GFA family protein [Sphingomonas aracearum]|uniref:GFA family protein n=1 Tax=Sphingomonas aracearum TaxID=2283317 RepID=UPI00269DE411
MPLPDVPARVGHVSAALKQVAVADVEWLTRAPDRFRSSPFARRGFCAECGTSLTYEGDGELHMDLTIGSFDHPARFRPMRHHGVESRHPAWVDTGHLSAMRTDENANIAAKWKSLGTTP